MANLTTRGLGGPGNIVSFGFGGSVFIVTFPLGVTIDINSDVLRVFDVDSETTRDFLIVAHSEDRGSLLAKELTSEVMRMMGLETEVIRSTDIESIIRMDDELISEVER